MNNKYLILNFQNAKLFRKFINNQNLRNKDKVYYQDGCCDDRDLYPSFKESITVHQVSNVLHVFFNERPVPSLRKGCVYPKNNHYFNMAKNSYLKIDTPKNRKLKDGTDFYYETTQIKKAVYNAWARVSITWEIAKTYIGNDDTFLLFVNKLNELLKFNSLSMPIMMVRDKIRELNENNLSDFYFFISNELKGHTLFTYFFGITETGTLIKPDNSKLTSNVERTGKTINNGIDTIINLSGQIVVPVSDEDIEKLETSSKGFANILDNGLVWIDSIKYDYDLELSDFIKVSEISDELIKSAK